MASAARARHAVAIGVATAIAAVGLAGCARSGEDASSSTDTVSGTDTVSQSSELSWDAQALEAIGFSPADLAPAAAVADPAASEPTSPRADPSARPDRPKRPHRRLQLRFHKRMLHAEAVVQTDEGTKTVVVQRGTVTAIDDDSITVRSADGFTLTWGFRDPLRVVERRNQVQPTAISVGRSVGVAGAKDGDAVVARLVVILVAR